MERRAEDGGSPEVSQVGQASDQGLVQQAGRDVHNWYAVPAPVVVLPRLGFPRLVAVLWSVVSFVVANVLVIVPRMRGADSAFSGFSASMLSLGLGTIAVYLTGVVVYLLVRALSSARRQEGLREYWVKGLVRRALIAAGVWWATLALSGWSSNSGIRSPINRCLTSSQAAHLVERQRTTG